MHLIERTPRTYQHRGYMIQALACGPHRWNVWRPQEEIALCGVQSLQEAAALIEGELLQKRMARSIVQAVSDWEAQTWATRTATGGEVG